MHIRHTGDLGPLRDERGFTLPEVLTTIAILGILLAIAMVMWNSIIEARRVDAAANQLASDLRLAHTRATNQLTDWRVVMVLDRTEERNADGSPNPDYYLIRLDEPYDDNSDGVVQAEDPGKFRPRAFDGNVKATQTYTDQGDSDYDSGYVDPEPGDPPPDTLTFEFNSDGSSWTYPGVSGSACVTVDGAPELKATVLAATSRVEIQEVEDDEVC